MKKIIFMMGTPAAGKTRTVKEKFSNYKVLDCDAIKKDHPDYDPKNPQILHDWSAKKLTEQFNIAVTKNESFVYDGTGSNSEKYVQLIELAKLNGFQTRLVYVVCPLRICLERNQKRTRTVSEDMLKEKYSTIETSFKLVAPFADKIQVINN